MCCCLRAVVCVIACVSLYMSVLIVLMWSAIIGGHMDIIGTCMHVDTT